MKVLSTSGIFVVKDDKISLRESKPLPVLELFSKMCQVFFDTYYIVLTMLDQVCGKHIILKQKTIIFELH